MLVKFKNNRQFDVMTTVNGKVSFPESLKGFSSIKPIAGSVWEVETVGQNKSGKVNFLRLIRGPMEVGNGVKIQDGAVFTPSGRGHLVEEYRGKHCRIQNWQWFGGKVRNTYAAVQIAIQGKIVKQVGGVSTSRGQKADLTKFHNLDIVAEAAEAKAAEVQSNARRQSWKQRETEAKEKWSKFLATNFPGAVLVGMYNDQASIKVIRLGEKNGIFIDSINEKSMDEIRQEIEIES